MDWFLIENGERVGPLSTDQMVARIGSGQLKQTDLVWRAGFSEWLHARDVEGLFKPPPQSVKPADPEQQEQGNPIGSPGCGHHDAPESSQGVTETLWQYKYGRNSSRESSPVQLRELVALAKANKIRRLTPVRMSTWTDYKYAQDVPEIMEVLTDTPTAWLKFWTYIRLPAGLLVGLVKLTDTHFGSEFESLVTVVISVPLFALVIATIVGLHRRRLWGWRLNWVVLFTEAVLYPLTRLRDSLNGPELLGFLFGGWLVIGLIWVWPNYIYFKKRRALFN